jgi:hypothetical protein
MLWKRIGMKCVKNATFYIQPAHSWWQGFLPYAPAGALPPQEDQLSDPGASFC